MKLNVSITGDAQSLLRRKIEGLSGAGRRELHQAMGVEVQEVTFRHLLSLNMHDTANRLGATPTNYWEQAAEKVIDAGALTSDAEAATLTLDHPGLGRAFHPVTIVPNKSSALTIPINALSYGRRAGEFEGLIRIKDLLVLKGASGEITPLFVLKRSVTQQQDRSILPSEQEWTDAATLGAIQYIRNL